METTMRTTKIDRFAAENRPDQPRITQEQLEAWLYNDIGGTVAKQIEELLNSGGYDITSYGLGIIPAVAPEPPKPTFLPIDRPVRIEDVEPGDVLRFTSSEKWASTEGAPHDGFPALGSEVIVNSVVSLGGRRRLNYSCTTGRGEKIDSQFCSQDMFSFVRRPFKAGEAVRYKASATKALGWEGALLVDTSETDRPVGYGIAVMNHKGVLGAIKASDLERIL